MAITRIFSDMDGSLLDSRGRVSDRNAHLIKEAGIPVTLVSARAPMEMKEAADQLGLTGTQIGFNGGLIYQFDGDRVQAIREQPLAAADARKLIQYINQTFPHLSQSYYDRDRWYTYKLDAGIDYESQLTRQQPTLIGEDVYLKPQEPVFKIMLITFDAAEMAVLKQSLDSLQLDAVAIQQSGAFYLEITHAAAKKSTGIDYVLASEKLRKRETACFGDGHNDLPMFEKVGTPIAMGNAAEAIKQRAVHVTLSHDQDGVGQGIWDYLKTP